MQYDGALKKFGECYQDRYKIEFPLIFQLCDFTGKTVLEIGSGREGHFIREAIKIAKKFVATDTDDDILNELKKNVNVEARVCLAENLVFPSEEGDETKLLMIKYPEKHEYRKQRIEKIKKCIAENGFKVKEERRLLNFLFPDTETAIDVLSAIEFRNELSSKEKIKLRDFLSSRKGDGIAFTQGACFICGSRD